MNYFKTWIALSLLLSTSVACISSVHPISSPETAYYDEDLIGAWVGGGGGEGGILNAIIAPFWIHFYKAEDSMTEGVIIFSKENIQPKHPGLSAAFIKVYPSKIGDHGYLNVKPFLPDNLLTPERSKEFASAKYELVWYEVKGDLLTLWMLQDMDDVVGQEILPGTTIQADFGGGTLTATSAELAKFLRTADHEKYFGKIGEMHRVKMPTESPKKPK
jgi:hypothetical protein